MSDPRFFTPEGPFALGYLAAAVDAELQDPGCADRLVYDVAPLSKATITDISFFDNPRYLDELAQCRAGAVILKAGVSVAIDPKTASILTGNPYKTYAKIARLFYPLPVAGETTISPHAIVHETASLGDGCVIEDGVVIQAHAKLGNRVHIGANAVIGRSVEIDEDAVVGACASLSHCLIGKRTRILTGARIGKEGFGFAIDPAGHLRIPQLGRVLIGDDVEIGANTTIDRGAGPDTIIERNVMIDNLVHIGHNVVIRQNCVIVSLVGLSGSVHVGEGVMIGGQAGVAGHLKIGSNARIAARSGVIADVAENASMMGFPAMPARQFLRQIGWLKKMVSAARGANDKSEPR